MCATSEDGLMHEQLLEERTERHAEDEDKDEEKDASTAQCS